MKAEKKESSLTSYGKGVKNRPHKSKRETFGVSLFAVRTGLEPVTSCVTGRHSNQAELTHLSGFAVAKVCIFFYSSKENREIFKKNIA